MHIEFLLEEESCAEALKILVPKIIGNQVSFATHTFQGKTDLLQCLLARLRGYAKWLPTDWRIVVLVDRDHEACLKLKAKLEKTASDAGLATRTRLGRMSRLQVLNRIAVEELEAWFFGDVEAITAAYPRVPKTLAEKRGFHNPDAISGGTWEALERILKQAGYYAAGMPKIEVARNIGQHLLPHRNRSDSFKAFCQGLREMVQ
jgi:hypothetical protein